MWKVSCLIIIGFITWNGSYFLFFAYVGRPLRVYIGHDLLTEENMHSGVYSLVFLLEFTLLPEFSSLLRLSSVLGRSLSVSTRCRPGSR
ncbi:hypothetical protein CMEL01_04384 [Colletotrichum melonis]|uniref:Uncharacterized protein n=1 Tax=Colletotrichum melonis TaxID=1209925 RepID=A0AAI9UGL2_9PEZI|nr:hypothetical protein CMEL01_04384 [Colletotrichum melonis]